MTLLDARVALQKTSLVDYPGKTAAVVFFPFCNLRCPWCHNGELITQGPAGRQSLIPLRDALSHIEKRRRVLGGVVLSGGEPTLFGALPSLIARIKGLGPAVKLDTNGTNPAMIKELLASGERRPDYIALDVKFAPRRYAGLEVSGAPPPSDARPIAERLAESLTLIRQSGVPHELRSLALPHEHFTEEDVDALAPLAADSPWHFRAFRPGACLDPAWNAAPPTPPERVASLAAYARSFL
jgi:pyruvate formate lyase activating enzyme